MCNAIVIAPHPNPMPARPSMKRWQVSRLAAIKPVANATATWQCPAPDRSESGQALVEFALVLLFMILPFTFVLVDGSLTLFTLASVTNAACEGARAAAIYLCEP